MTATEVMERHFLRGGKFIMACYHDEPIGSVATMTDPEEKELIEHKFLVVRKSSFEEGKQNRPVEWLHKPMIDDRPFYFEVAPVD